MLIVSLGICVGTGVMFVPLEVFQGIPGMIRGVVSNGMLVGIILVLIMEHLIMKKKGAISQ